MCVCVCVSVKRGVSVHVVCENSVVKQRAESREDGGVAI